MPAIGFRFWARSAAAVQLGFEGYKIELGGKTLSFLSALLLHWPDNIFAYLWEDKILFSGDCFGSHVVASSIFDDEIEADFIPEFKYYYDHIMAPFKKYVIKALNRLERVDINLICPGHGPVLRQDPGRYMDYYRQWAASKEPAATIKVVIAYASAYGYTKMLGEQIAAGMLEEGDIEVKWFDLVYRSPQEVMAELEDAQGLLIGTPTINKDAVPPVWQLLAQLSPITHSGLIAVLPAPTDGAGRVPMWHAAHAAADQLSVRLKPTRAARSSWVWGRGSQAKRERKLVKERFELSN